MYEPDTTTITALALILLGAILMFANIVRFRTLMNMLKQFDYDAFADFRHYSLAPLLFMIFFCLAYVFVLVAMTTGYHFLGDQVLGVILFFGAVFVFIAIRFQAKTVAYLHESRERLRHESIHDPLTGLPNRFLIHDRLRQAIERSSRSSGQFYFLVFMNLDRFKNINDSLGHTMGDETIIEVGKRILSCVRSVDTVSRFGGDEFVILLDGTSPYKTLKVIRRIRAALARPTIIQGHSLNITAGFGIYYGPTSEDNPDMVLQNAHLALHGAKRQGTNKHKVFRTTMLDTAVHTMALEHDMLRGIRKKEFEAYFQPVVSLNDPPVLLGFEALARWRHPAKGLVSPMDFIPVAEDTGLIADIGNQILAQACAMRHTIVDAVQGLNHIHMAVNLSMLQINQSFFDSKLLKTITAHNTQPNELTLEVTESAIMEQTDSTIGRLARLRERGFSVAIDDFGTGYSSFAYLKDLPATHIKIDQAFIHNLSESRTDQEIVKSMIVMGHSLFMTVVAEGIETREQLELLRGFGCDCIQGYYYSKPLPPGEVVAYVQDFLARNDAVAPGQKEA